MSSTNEDKSVVLWYLNGCLATFYKAEKDDEPKKKKELIDTISFTNKAYLAYRQVNSLSIAAPAVLFLTHLSSLQLQNNNLVTLPKELWRLTSLNELNLGHNQLTELPIEVGQLTQLRELFLHNNKLSKIPSQIGRLSQLDVLDLTCNKLTYLPGEITKLKLKNLWTEHNEFGLLKQDEEVTFISLKSICAQTIGLLCIDDEDSRKVVQDTIVHEDGLLSIHQNTELYPICYECSNLLFHSGLNVVKNDKIPLLFKVCSQNCFIQLNYFLDYI